MRDSAVAGNLDTDTGKYVLLILRLPGGVTLRVFSFERKGKKNEQLSHRIPRPGLAQLIGKPKAEGTEEHDREGTEAETQSQEAGEKENIHFVNTSPTLLSFVVDFCNPMESRLNLLNMERKGAICVLFKNNILTGLEEITEAKNKVS